MIYNLAAGVLFHSILIQEVTPRFVPMAVRLPYILPKVNGLFRNARSCRGNIQHYSKYY